MSKVKTTYGVLKKELVLETEDEIIFISTGVFEDINTVVIN